MKRYLADKVENMRDIGGYETPFGMIPEKRFIRSCYVPPKITDAATFLCQLGVYTAIDLRTPRECAEAVTVFENHPNFNVRHFPFIAGAEVPQTTDEIAATYMEIAAETENIKNILTTIFNTDGGVVYYCYAGKDRTGVVTALVMLILGVSEDDIIADYVLSRDFLAQRLHEYSVAFNLDEKLITPQPRYMQEFLAAFKQKYGNIDKYLQQMNLSADMLRQQVFGHN
ncbi:MAG: tyrosine-protein phosphatase [Alphaproteobacteria bacterium]|nr:tyrosine-protein phosphatase [Alphaproteobacteria bacterium]